MGIFDLLSKEGRQKGALERAIKKVSDKHAQSEDRTVAIHKLAENGSEEALYGLARRFAFTYDKGIQDEQEKELAADFLSSKGEVAVGPVKQFLLEAASVSWGLKVLHRIARPDRLWPIVDELLEREPPGYTRDPDKKIELITWMGEWTDASPEDVARRIIPYLADFDEGVRFAAIDALHHRPHASALEPLVEALTKPEEESRRIKVRVADLLADTDWVLPAAKKEAVAKLLEGELTGYGMHHDKLTKKGK